MKIHLRADEANGTHTRFTVFMNGGNCGQLCMTEEEATCFHDMVMHSAYVGTQFGDDVYTSGRWVKE